MRHVLAPLLLLLLLAPAPSARGHQVEPEIDCLAPELDPPSELDPLAVVGASHTLGCAIEAADDVDTFFFFDPLPHRLIRVIALAESDYLDPSLVVTIANDQVSMLPGSCQSGSAAQPAPRCSVAIEFMSRPNDSVQIELSDQGMDETGAYTLQVEEIPNPDPADLIDDSRPNPFFDFTQASPATDVDQYSALLAEAERLRVEVHSCGDWFDPRIEIRDPGGSLVADTHCETPAGPYPPLTGIPIICSNDEGADPVSLCTAEATIEATSAGVYDIAISDYGSNGPARYEYYVTRLPEPAPALLGAGALLVLALRRALCRDRADAA